MKKNILNVSLLTVCASLTIGLAVGTSAQTNSFNYKTQEAHALEYPTPSPENYFVFSNGTITGYKGPLDKNVDIVIPHTIGGEPVTAIGSEVFKNELNVTSITIPSSVISIGDEAFYNCSLVNSVNFEEGSQLQSIGASAFVGCSFSHFVFPENVTTIGIGAFSYMPKLEDIVIPRRITAIPDSCFRGNPKLSSVSFADGTVVSSFGKEAFSWTKIQVFVIPSTVNRIDDNAFCSANMVATYKFLGNCDNLSTKAFSDSKNADLYRKTRKNTPTSELA